MNRRAFLSGLLASGAALSVSSPVVQVLPYREGPEFLYPMLGVQPHWCQDVVQTIIYATDESPILYNGVRLFVDAPPDENTVWGV